MLYLKILLGGIGATAVMTLFILLAGALNLPVTNPGVALGALFDNNETVGWALHFVIGTGFSFLYVMLLNKWLPVTNDIARGAVFGIIVWVFSGALLLLINLTGAFPVSVTLDLVSGMFAGLFGCFIYGMVLGGIIRKYHYETFLDWEKKDYLWRFKKRQEHKFVE